MKNLTWGRRLVVASPTLVLMILGTVVWDMKILAVVGLVYLFIADSVLKKKKQVSHDHSDT